MSDFIQVRTTTNTEAEAHAIARALVEQRLAACAQISGPITSVFRWQGAIEQGTEWQCAVKTRAELFDQVAAVIRELHSYDCPQIVAVPLVGVSDDYRAWLEQECKAQ